MKLNLTISTVDGDELTVPVRPRTQVAYERQFKARLDSDVSMEGLYWLAWHASGNTSKFDRWLDTIESVSAVAQDDDEDDESGADPLVVVPPSGTSLPSPSNPVTESRSIS